MNFTAKEIISSLGGVAAVSRILNIKMQSVSEWLKNERIPEGRLARLAPFAEKATAGKERPITRKKLFPEDYLSRWPELGERNTKKNS